MTDPFCTDKAEFCFIYLLSGTLSNRHTPPHPPRSRRGELQYLKTLGLFISVMLF